jgi:uracil-DNA glycosylase
MRPSMNHSRASVPAPLESCRACPRLARHLDEVRESHPDYHCGPVASWGRSTARLLVVGLAPGRHVANRTGRPFTGDASGTFLFAALSRGGFVTSPDPHRARLRDIRITNAVRCLPPGNRPVADEITRCSGYLADELAELWQPRMRHPRGVLALGRLAHGAIGIALGLRLPEFAHGQAITLEAGLTLFDTYHPSRQNTNTGRLTAPMLDAVLERVRAHLYS